jgi:dTDP-4-dehydrorhamnose reductase
MKILLYGGRGWMGSHFIPYINQDVDTVVYGASRLENYDSVMDELHSINPDRVVCFVGRTHTETISNIDCLESMPFENIRDNLFAPVILVKACQASGIHVTYIGTGCIYQSGDDDTEFLETDPPNYNGSAYSHVKGSTDLWMSSHPDGLLHTRFRLPISRIEGDKRCILEKLKSFQYLQTDRKQSVSILPELYPVLYDMIRRGYTGTVNMVSDPRTLQELIPDRILPIRHSTTRCFCILSNKKLKEYDDQYRRQYLQ